MQKFILGFVVLPMAGCTASDDPDGQTIYSANCAACHGTKGYGDGNFAERLQILPADLTELAENAGGTFPAEYVLAKIDGFSAEEHFAGAMPRFGRIVTGDRVASITPDGVVSLSQKELHALLIYVESLQGT